MICGVRLRLGMLCARISREHEDDDHQQDQTNPGQSASRASAQDAAWARTSWIQNNMLRWGWSSYKLTKGVWAGGLQKLHFHLGPVMKQHLPWQWRPWMHQTPLVVKKWWKNICQ
jgi:hypothetical protein